MHQFGPVAGSAEQAVTACNSFYVTIANQIGQPGNSVPLRRVEGIVRQSEGSFETRSLSPSDFR